MAKSRRLTQKEIEVRKTELREWRVKHDSDPKFLKIRSWLMKTFDSEDERLCGFAARQIMLVSILNKENEKIVELLNLKGTHAGILLDKTIPPHIKRNIAISIQEDYPGDESASIYAQVIAMELQASKRGRAAADARHSKPGGSRDKRQEILDCWASGKYTSRDRCAEQECEAIGLSFSKARNHLIGTPDNPKSKPKVA